MRPRTVTIAMTAIWIVMAALIYAGTVSPALRMLPVALLPYYVLANWMVHARPFARRTVFQTTPSVPNSRTVPTSP